MAQASNGASFRVACQVVDRGDRTVLVWFPACGKGCSKSSAQIRVFVRRVVRIPCDGASGSFPGIWAGTGKDARRNSPGVFSCRIMPGQLISEIVANYPGWQMYPTHVAGVMQSLVCRHGEPVPLFWQWLSPLQTPLQHDAAIA